MFKDAAQSDAASWCPLQGKREVRGGKRASAETSEADTEC
jgi:hypothetical protein